MERWVVVILENDDSMTVVVDAEDVKSAVTAGVSLATSLYPAFPAPGHAAKAWRVSELEPGELDPGVPK